MQNVPPPPPPPPSPEADARLGAAVRFGCGLIFGILFALFLGLVEMGTTMGAVLLILAGSALVFGWLSMVWGDRFWRLIPWLTGRIPRS